MAYWRRVSYPYQEPNPGEFSSYHSGLTSRATLLELGIVLSVRDQFTGMYTVYCLSETILLGLYTVYCLSQTTLLGLYTVYSLPETHFTGTVHSVLFVRDTFTKTEHSVLSVKDIFYWDCTQCNLRQRHILLGVYTVYCLSETHFTGTAHSVLSVRDHFTGIVHSVLSVRDTFSGTEHSALSVRDTFFWDCTQCTVCQRHFTGAEHSVLSVRDTFSGLYTV